MHITKARQLQNNTKHSLYWSQELGKIKQQPRTQTKHNYKTTQKEKLLSCHAQQYELQNDDKQNIAMLSTLNLTLASWMSLKLLIFVIVSKHLPNGCESHCSYFSIKSIQFNAYQSVVNLASHYHSSIIHMFWKITMYQQYYYLMNL